MPNRNPSKHEQMMQRVERSLRKVGRHMLQGAALEGCLKLWREFAGQVDLGQTRKPQTWAAALAYAYERMRLGLFSQDEIAGSFGISPITVSQKYRQIAHTLNLVLLDARYIPEAMRATIQREQGPLPEALPLTQAPAGGWGWQPPLESMEGLEAWLEERERGPLRRAQDLVYEGWEALESPGQAESCFRKALRLDPTLADAHNGLGRVAEAREDLALAQSHYHRAYELAREALGTESPQAFYWWGELETRPYMRARQGLGWIHWQTGRYRDALMEYGALLKLNPNDNQGVRRVLGPLYQLAGDLQGALRAYDRYEKAYPDDMGDPHHTMCWGLALYGAGRHREAVHKWRQGIFENVYIVPLLLGQRPPSEDIWLFTNLAWPGYAEQYLHLFGALWKGQTGALQCLRRLWKDQEMQADVKSWLMLGQRLQAVSASARQGESGAKTQWGQWIKERKAIEERAPSQALLARVVG